MERVEFYLKMLNITLTRLKSDDIESVIIVVDNWISLWWVWCVVSSELWWVMGCGNQDVIWPIINDETHQQPERSLRGSNCLYQRSNSAMIPLIILSRRSDRWPYLDVEVCYFPGIFPQHLSHLSQSLQLGWGGGGVGNPGLVPPSSQERFDCVGDQGVTARVTRVTANNTPVRDPGGGDDLPDGKEGDVVAGLERERAVPRHEAVLRLLELFVILGVELQHPGEVRQVLPVLPVCLNDDAHGVTGWGSRLADCWLLTAPVHHQLSHHRPARVSSAQVRGDLNTTNTGLRSVSPATPASHWTGSGSKTWLKLVRYEAALPTWCNMRRSAMCRS